MAELIRCRSCDSPNCRGCNVYILDQALHYGKLDGLMDDNKTIRIPTIGVRPVVRGVWNAVKGALHPAETSAVCSNCGFTTMIHAQTFYNFCPNCGAMQGDGNGM